MSHFLDTPIEFLKGVGPQRAELLKKEANIHTYYDLLQFYPFRYEDRSQYHKVAEITTDLPYVQLKGKITFIDEAGQKRAKRLIAYLQDETGSVELIWFKGIKWVKPILKVGQEYIIYGKPSQYKSKYNIAHPEINHISNHKATDNGTLIPVYHSTEKLSVKGLHSKGLAKLAVTLSDQIHFKIPEVLSKEILDSYGFVTREKAFLNIHQPENAEQLKKARIRLKFEELFFLQLKLLRAKLVKNQKYNGYKFDKIGDYFNDFYKKYLPFELTNAQKKVLKEIRIDCGNGKQMNRLLQGDVGSGKTLVALMTCLMAIDNGFQACIMAPTEILASQHFISISEMLKGMNLKIGLLTGSVKKKDRVPIHQSLEDGSMHLLIGTHALLEDTVKFKNLGIAIVDEQHRFGVAQRAKMWRKNTQPPHVLVMTATPIPRTLAMTLYGDLDISVIDELPPGRKTIQTIHRFDSARIKVFGFIEDEIKKGRQVYIVYPLIQESETLDYKDLMDGYESICRRFPLPEYKTSIVHGKMKPEDKEFEMQRFVKGETQIMVATTVIEVGVNVPNASIMIIESAERFGLSQLHQLRGRVGRGAKQSYCVLMTGYKLGQDGRTRMETMVRTNDGFEISEVDLKLRGPGDLTGTQQSGIVDLKIADIVKDNQILVLARDVAIQILKDDPNLEHENNFVIKRYLSQQGKGRINWGRIS
jgi:ATP-dependent DNA helicase RecG